MANSIVEDTVKSLLECNENGEVLRKESPPSIFMVPSVVRDLSPSSFNPRVVAIGPLHRQDEHLQQFEVKKTIYLNNWLRRLGMVPEQTLRECAEKVIHSIERIKACYAAGSTTYADFELAKIMVIDACFILEFIQSLPTEVSFPSNVLITGSIIYDLLLIENQIPFFVLEIIFECTMLTSERTREWASLTSHMELLLEFYDEFEGNVVQPGASASAPDHILGFLHQRFRPAEPIPPVYESVSESITKRHTAMELDSAGMNFKPYNTEEKKWALAMKLEFPLPLFPWLNIFMAIPPFSWFRRPTLRMPKASIGDYTELTLRNLIVYEQSSNVEKYVTSYLSALDYLIDTAQDVAVLVKSGVLVSYMGSNEDVADMINNLCENIVYSNFLYDREWEEMDAYYNSYWPNTFAVLKRTYFNNPWSIIALFAAFLLFALTATQTIFTIKTA